MFIGMYDDHRGLKIWGGQDRTKLVDRNGKHGVTGVGTKHGGSLSLERHRLRRSGSVRWKVCCKSGFDGGRKRKMTTSERKYSVGVIGIGKMGSPMAIRIAAYGATRCMYMTSRKRRSRGSAAG